MEVNDRVITVLCSSQGSSGRVAVAALLQRLIGRAGDRQNANVLSRAPAVVPLVPPRKFGLTGNYHRCDVAGAGQHQFREKQQFGGWNRARPHSGDRAP